MPKTKRPRPKVKELVAFRISQDDIREHEKARIARNETPTEYYSQLVAEAAPLPEVME